MRVAWISFVWHAKPMNSHFFLPISIQMPMNRANKTISFILFINQKIIYEIRLMWQFFSCFTKWVDMYVLTIFFIYYDCQLCIIWNKQPTITTKQNYTKDLVNKSYQIVINPIFLLLFHSTHFLFYSLLLQQLYYITSW